MVFIIIWLSPFGRFVLKGGLAELQETPFDKQQWIAARNAEPLVLRKRLLMLEDLMENHLKKGTDSATVKEMLGEPERQYGFSYALGTLTEGMEPFFLIMDFDTTGLVTGMHVKNETSLEDEDASIRIELKD